MMQCSGGCEPEFALSYTRHTVNLNEDYQVYCKSVQEYCEVNRTTPENLPPCFVSSERINWKDRIETQGIMQKWVDTAISSTVNLPKEISIEEVEQMYLYAWQQKLKGITIFRSGCKRVAILNTDTKKDDKKPEIKSSNINTTSELPRGTILNCCDDLVGKKKKLTTGCGSLHVLGYFDPSDGSLQEVYLSKGSTGGCQNFMIGLSRTISLLCRAGVDIYTIKDQLDSTGSCPSYAIRSATHHDTSKGSCCPMAIGNALIAMYEDFKRTLNESDDDSDIDERTDEMCLTPANAEKTYETCPECGAPLAHENGCVSCKSCGYSKCG